MALPLVGHLDPFFSTVIDELQVGLRRLFGVDHPVTFAASGTGTAGMELLLANLLEPGDTALVVVHGVFGGRMREACNKLGVETLVLEAAWGTAPDPAALDAVWDAAGRPALAALLAVHAETSTGVLLPDPAAFGNWARTHGALFILDTVTSFGGLQLDLPGWQVDAAFAGSQKCLAASPGLAPVTLGPRALERFAARRAPVPSWYLDLGKLLGYWEARAGHRVYHHTAPIAPLFGLHEAVRLVLTEGLPAVEQRVRSAAARLTTGLEARGFRYVVEDPAERLPTLHCLRPPAEVDEAQLRAALLAHHGLELGAGLGSLAGRALRIGLMGPNASDDGVTTVLAAIDAALPARP